MKVSGGGTNFELHGEGNPRPLLPMCMYDQRAAH